MKAKTDRFQPKTKRTTLKKKLPPTHFELLKSIIGAVKNGPADLAENHTFYAHGGKRR